MQHRWIDPDAGRVVWPGPAPGDDPERSLYFLHVPKTAGIALNTALRSMYRIEDVCPAYHEVEFDSHSSTFDRYRYLAGHFSLRPLEVLSERPAIVTVVREPLAHLRSYYAHGRRSPNHEYYPLWKRNSLAGWLRDPDTAFLNTNVQSTYLAGAVHVAVEIDDDELYERAVATLDECLWYSTTEQLGTSIPRLSTALHWPLPSTLLRANVAPEVHPDDTAEERELVEARGAVDLRVYEYASEQVRRLDAGSGPHSFAPASFEAELDRASVVLDRPLLVDLAEPFWGSGWWDTQVRDDGRRVRWMPSGRPGTVDLPVQLGAGDRIDLFIAQASDPRFVTGMEVRINGRRADVAAPHPCYPHFVVAATVVGSPSQRWTRVEITVPELTEVDPGNPWHSDERAVSIERMVLVPDDQRGPRR